MAKLIKSGENPKAAGTLTYGIEGQSPAMVLDSAGNMTLTGTVGSGATTLSSLTVNGVTMLDDFTTINADLILNINDATGGFNVTNAQAVTGTGNADLVLTEASAGSIAFGTKVSGDGDTRLKMDAGGNVSWGTGGAPADASLGRVSAGILGVKTGSLQVATAGQGLQIKEGTNAKQGTAVLVGGTKVVSTTAVTANSRIFLTSNVDGGTPGWLRVSAKTNGTSFTITSSSGTDTSTVAWLITEGA